MWWTYIVVPALLAVGIYGFVLIVRVNTRRLIAILELAKAVSGKADIGKLQRRFKKVLKRMGPLRDMQVVLLS